MDISEYMMIGKEQKKQERLGEVAIHYIERMETSE